MELRHLRYFVAIAEAGGFARAAARLHVSQPALSRQIRDLEDELHLSLFDRSKRTVRLTMAGESFLHDMQHLLKHLEQAQTRAYKVHTGKFGVLTIGLADPFSWHDVITISISAFRKHYPDVSLTVEVMVSRDQLAALREGRISAGFLVTRPREEQDFEAITIFTDKVMLAVVDSSPFATRTPRLRELSKETLFVFPQKVNQSYHDSLIKACHNSGLGSRLVEGGMNDTANLSLVSAGLGCTFVPSEARWRKPKNVALVSVRDLNVSLTLELVWHRENRQQVLDNFIETVKMTKTRKKRHEALISSTKGGFHEPPHAPNVR